MLVDDRTASSEKGIEINKEVLAELEMLLLIDSKAGRLERLQTTACGDNRRSARYRKVVISTPGEQNRRQSLLSQAARDDAVLTCRPRLDYANFGSLPSILIQATSRFLTGRDY